MTKKKIKTKNYDAELMRQVIELEQANAKLQADLDYYKTTSEENSEKLNKVLDILCEGCGY